MKRIALLLAALLAAPALTGCGGSPEPADSSSAAASPAPTAPPVAASAGRAADRPTSATPAAGPADPQQIVRTFLEATRHGDEATAAKMLTRKALEETSKIGLVVRPPGTPSMKYTIHGVQYAEREGVEGAYVKCTWTEQNDQGEEDIQVIWVLRQQEAQWRIAGMAAQLQPNDEPLLLDFESPEELQRRLQQPASVAEAPQAGPSPGSEPAGQRR